MIFYVLDLEEGDPEDSEVWENAEKVDEDLDVRNAIWRHPSITYLEDNADEAGASARFAISKTKDGSSYKIYEATVRVKWEYTVHEER